MAKIIGITGLAGAGKDALAQALAGHLRSYGVQVTIAGFADTIRQISHSTGLDPYTRAVKEVKVTMSLDVFCDNLQFAIDKVLAGRMNWYDRQQLYVLTIDNLRKFVSVPVGSGLTEYINVSPREFMQVLGTEAGQSIRKTLWVDFQYGNWCELGGVVLVTDFRFEHEAPVLDWIVVVARPGVVRVNDHKSEDLPEELTTLPASEYMGVHTSYIHNASDLACLDLLAQAEAHYQFHVGLSGK